MDELLELVELDPALVRDRHPDELSGGEQQRVGVARALAASPRLMLLDEPFGALDPLTRDRLQQSFLRIRRQLGLTAIFVTHDMVEALLVGDRIAVMHGGRLAADRHAIRAAAIAGGRLRPSADEHAAASGRASRGSAGGQTHVREQLALLPGYLTAHLQLTLFALLAGTAVSIPAGIAITRSRRLERPVLAVASVIQTVPSLALLAVMVPALSAHRIAQHRVSARVHRA